MVLLYSEAVKQITHTLGTNPGGTNGPSAKRLIDMAGGYLYSMYPWNFLDQGFALLNKVSGQAYVTLPVDFKGLQCIEVAGNSDLGRFQVVSPGRLQELQTIPDAPGEAWTYGTLSYIADEDAGLVPRYDICPVPTDSATGYWTLSYDRKWPTLAEDTKALPIPGGVGLESLFLQCVSAYARGYYREDVTPLAQQLELVRQSHEFMAAKMADNEANMDLGQLGPGASLQANGPAPTMRGDFTDLELN
jgi:hypothetical protein